MTLLQSVIYLSIRPSVRPSVYLSYIKTNHTRKSLLEKPLNDNEPQSALHAGIYLQAVVPICPYFFLK